MHRHKAIRLFGPHVEDVGTIERVVFCDERGQSHTLTEQPGQISDNGYQFEVFLAVIEGSGQQSVAAGKGWTTPGRLATLERLSESSKNAQSRILVLTVYGGLRTLRLYADPQVGDVVYTMLIVEGSRETTSESIAPAATPH